MGVRGAVTAVAAATLACALAAAAVAAGVGGPGTLLSVRAAAAPPPSPPKVVGFWLINDTSGRWFRRLHAEDAVDLDAVGPFALAAAAVAGRGGPDPDTVVYTSPEVYAHAERGRPFSLAGDGDGGRPARVALPVGTHTITAIATATASGRAARTTTLQSTPASVRLTLYHGRRREVGPLPGDLPAPPRPAGCGRLPNVSATGGASPDGDVGAWDGGWFVHYCAGARFRWRLFAAPLRAGSRPRRVRQALFRVDPSIEPGTPVNVPDSWLSLRRGCKSEVLWSEVCVSVGGVPVCAVGEVGTLTALPPPLVTLVLPIPPRAIHLAPGDAIALTTRLSSLRDTGNEGQGTGPALRLVGVIRRLDGTARRSEVVTNGTALVNRLLLRGVTAADDGATAYVEVSRQSCPTAVAAVATVGHTRLIVSAHVAPLMQPDTAPPSVPVVSFPPTIYGEAANVSAVATNGGGGYRLARRGGRQVRVPTALSWQWFVRRHTHSVSVSEQAEATTNLVGQTRPVLQVPAVGCDTKNFCHRWGCQNRLLYIVEACNTAGCVRSVPVAPAVRPPANAARARWLEENKGCSWVGATGHQDAGGNKSPA